MNFNRDTYACSICSNRLPRQFVHRNRAGAYICHPCQAAQANAPYALRLRAWLRLQLHRAGYTALKWGAGFALALAVAYLLVMAAA
jgi:hypothetical protein